MARFRGMIFLAAGFAVVLTFSLPGIKAQSSQSADAPKTTEQVYKNIKVLKGILAYQLIPSMQFISASLGVKCDHCHAQGHFDSDDKKPKEAARHMMTMMFAINKDNFDDKRKVTCFSCHRGAVKPISTPVINAAATQMMAMPENAEPAKVDLSQLPSGIDLIDKYVKAIGGEPAVARLSSRTVKGSISGMGGRTFPMEAFYKSSGQSAIFTHLSNGDAATVNSGRDAWMSFPGRPAQALEGSELDAAKIDGDIQLPVHMKTVFNLFKAAAPEKIGNREAFHILATREGQPPVEFYFDEQSGLLVRQVRYADSPLGLFPTQIDYSDYRAANGVKIPYRVVTSHPGSVSTLQIEQVQQNVPIPEAKFAKPAGQAMPEQKH